MNKIHHLPNTFILPAGAENEEELGRIYSPHPLPPLVPAMQANAFLSTQC